MASLGKNITVEFGNNKTYKIEIIDNNSLLIKESENDIFYFLDWIDDIKNKKKAFAKRVCKFKSDRRSGYLHGCFPVENFNGDIILSYDSWVEENKKRDMKTKGDSIVNRKAKLRDGITLTGTHPKIGTIIMDADTEFLYSESLDKCFPTEGIFKDCGYDPTFFDISEELVLLGVFSEFSTKTVNRPYYDEADYLKRIDGLKDKVGSKFVSGKEFNDLTGYINEVLAKKLDTTISYAEFIAKQCNKLADRVEELEKNRRTYYLSRLENGDYVLNSNF